ncbi:hypothetical protein [Oceanobacillus sp. FSL W7-1309]|uniref:hypothetical protein n=1 Tax=Oceanobacillus sp. FSL W7-1309 TaxID=2954539 RepID=UPI0030F66949
MTPRRIHVIKAPTNNRTVFPYSHYSDEGHNPLISAHIENNHVILTCEDLFKLKPNVQQNPRTRVDIYMPGYAGLELGNDILALVGAGNIAELTTVNPEDFRNGPQTLPLIDEARRVRQHQTMMNIAGCTINGNSGPVYMDRERPNEGHIEMVGPEIHLGIPLSKVNGTIDLAQTREYNVPETELRIIGESNPVRKAYGRLTISFEIQQAQNLAATLIFYGQHH